MKKLIKFHDRHLIYLTDAFLANYLESSIKFVIESEIIGKKWKTNMRQSLIKYTLEGIFRIFF